MFEGGAHAEMGVMTRAPGWWDVRVLARVLPFLLYMVFLALEDVLAGVDLGFDLRWLYPVKIAGVVFLLALFRAEYTELASRPSRVQAGLLAPAVGILVFMLWIHLDGGWLVTGAGTGYSPLDEAGRIRWELAVPRLLGAAVVVPVMEELFWRSFLLRWIERHDFLQLEPARIGLRALLIGSLLFGLEHSLWFAGILAGLAYAWLYRTSGSLWPPVIAHAVTNLALGIWVLATGAWSFW